MLAFDLAQSVNLLIFGAGSQVIAGRHAEAVADQIGDAEDHDNARCEPRAGDPGDDCESGHRAIDTAIDRVFQVTLGWRLGQTRRDLRRIMRMLQPRRSGLARRGRVVVKGWGRRAAARRCQVHDEAVSRLGLCG